MRYIAQLLTKNLWCTMGKVSTPRFAELLNLFNIPYSNVRPIRCGMSLQNILL